MNDLLLKLCNILEDQEEEIKKINEWQYLEYYAFEQTGLTFPFLIVSRDFLHYDRWIDTR